MPKKKHVFFIKAYNKDNLLVADNRFEYYCYDSAFSDYLELLGFLVKSEFNFVHRLDFVSSGRILFSCQSLRHVLNHKNYTINFNPY